MKLANASLCLLFAAGAASAAIPSGAAKPKPAKIMSGAGAVAGGLAGTGFSITNLTLAKTAGKERIVIDIGDMAGSPVRGYPGYYHVEMQENPRRLIIDFAQTPNAMIDEKAINGKLKDSSLVASSTLLLDPTDQTMSLILDLKKKAKAQVFQVPGKKGTGRVVVDLL